MCEQVPPEFVTRPLNRPVPPAPAQSDQAEAKQAKPDPAGAAGVPSGQAEPERRTTAEPSGAAAPPRTEAGAGPAYGPKSSWTRTPGGGSKAGTESDDVDQKRRDDRHLEAMVASAPLAAGEDRRADLALAREIDSAVEPKNIFDRWRVEDLFHATREITRYRTQRVELPNAARFSAIVALLMPYKNVFKVEAVKTARDYLGPESKERQQARNWLRSFGITDAAINAQAAALHEKSIAALDRLIAQGQTRRSNIVREVKRDKRRADKAKARKSRPDRPDQPELALH
jgi:hypothetical protein